MLHPTKIRAGWGLKKVSVLLGHSDVSITAKVYSHLLDGDLKVEDEFRLGFDKKAACVDIESARKADEKMATFMAQALTNTLSGNPDGRRVLSGLIQQFFEGSRSFSVNSLAEGKTSLRATPVLHTRPEGLAPSVVAPLADCDLALESEGLAGFKMEPLSGLEPETYALRKRCSTN